MSNLFGKPLLIRYETPLRGTISLRVEEDRYRAIFALSRAKRREFNERLRLEVDRILIELTDKGK
jgi:hypothetical protein